MPRYLGIDYGTRHIGLAVGDDVSHVASPVRSLEVHGSVADHVREVLGAAAPYHFDAIVLGLPLNMDGTEGEQARITRRFGGALARAANKPIHYHDERLSSFAARERLAALMKGRRRRRGADDAVAAQMILQEFLDAGRAVPPPMA